MLPHTLSVLRMKHQDRIAHIDDERDTGDGYWLYLKPVHFRFIKFCEHNVSKFSTWQSAWKEFVKCHHKNAEV